MAKKILVVDDEPVVVKLMETRLKTNGYEVFAAYDGESALRAISKEKPDLILLDIMLPKIDGYEVCRRLKKDAEYSDIPIVMFTAKAQKEDVREGVEAGADAYVKKPFDPQEILSTIKGLLGEK